MPRPRPKAVINRGGVDAIVALRTIL